LQGRYLYKTTEAQNKCRQISMPRFGLEPKIPVVKRPKIFYVLYRAATVTGNTNAV
jgi:hypothetical protein